MLTITFDKSKLKSRPLSALIRYLSDTYIEKVVLTGNFIFFTEKQVNILRSAALLEHSLVEDNYMFSYKDVFNKEQSFSKEDLLTFASNVKNQSLTINYSKRVKTNRLTKERLQFMYADCVNKLYELATATYKDNTARKINHYRQLLANNRDIWDYLSVKGMSSLDFYLKYNYRLKVRPLNLDSKLSIKDLLCITKQIVKAYKSPLSTTKSSVTAPRTIEWELEQYAKHKAAKAIKNKYKITITDCDTGNVVHEVYLPKEI